MEGLTIILEKKEYVIGRVLVAEVEEEEAKEWGLGLSCKTILFLIQIKNDLKKYMPCIYAIGASIFIDFRCFLLCGFMHEYWC